MGFPDGSDGKEFTCQWRKAGFDLWVRKIPWRRKWQPTAVFLPGESHGQRRLVGFSPRGRKEWATTECPHFTCICMAFPDVTSAPCIHKAKPEPPEKLYHNQAFPFSLHQVHSCSHRGEEIDIYTLLLTTASAASKSTQLAEG